jgi:S-adenosylmethionine:tRNA ribosyltransferase-isomerase
MAGGWVAKDFAGLFAPAQGGRCGAGQTAVAALAARALKAPGMRVDDFDFDLPESAIALAPASPRDSARLLHVDRGACGDFHVGDLPRLLRPGDLLVANDTRVIPAQLSGARAARDGEGEIPIEATLIKRLVADESSETRWAAFLRPAKRARTGDVIVFGEGFSAEVERRDGAEAILRFAQGAPVFNAMLAKWGATPLPPYIARKRRTTPDDARAYQTIYAAAEGSVAAPTAGLHFTPKLIEALAARDIALEKVTLHVGAGTFLPVTAADTSAHVMHAEQGEITPDAATRINSARRSGRRIVAIGTTSLRLLESAADAAGNIRPFSDETAIFITPGYRFRAVDALMTNFHLPRSTLFMLVCAFAGTEAMKRAYAHALSRGYRFYSYGDASLLERAQ